LSERKLKWSNDGEESIKIEVKETLEAAELPQQQTKTVLHHVFKEHANASKAGAELKTLLETAELETCQTKALLHQTSSNLEEASRERANKDEGTPTDRHA
jgi:hypothetical protein